MVLPPVMFMHLKVLWLVTSYLNKVLGTMWASVMLCALGLQGWGAVHASVCGRGMSHQDPHLPPTA